MTRRKLVHWRKPSVRLTPTGKIRVRKPSARIGGRVGVNVGSRGVHLTVHKKRRARAKRSGCGKTVAGSILLLLFGAVVWASWAGRGA